MDISDIGKCDIETQFFFAASVFRSSVLGDSAHGCIIFSISLALLTSDGFTWNSLMTFALIEENRLR